MLKRFSILATRKAESAIKPQLNKTKQLSKGRHCMTDVTVENSLQNNMPANLQCNSTANKNS